MGLSNRIIPAMYVMALLMQVAEAGMLDDFEKKAGATERKAEESSSSGSRTRANSETSAFGSGTYPSESGGKSFLGSFATWLVSSPFRYRPDDPGGSDISFRESGGEDWADEGDGLNFRHQPGAPILPYARGDFNWQYIDSDLDAADIRLEAGYKMLAFHGRSTRYEERDPSDDLTINQFYGVLRLGGTYPMGSEPLYGWEVGLGIGGVQQIGNEEHSSAALTVPIKVYPSEWLGFEFRPAWYQPQERAISDYDVSASIGGRLIHLRAGYRWLWLQGEGHFLNGPYAGLSASF